MRSKVRLVYLAWLIWHIGLATGPPIQREDLSKRSRCYGICEHGCQGNQLQGNMAAVLDMTVKAAPKCVPCPPGYTEYFKLENEDAPVEQSGSCYKILTRTEYWSKAAKICKETGGNLVSIETKQELEHIKKIVKITDGISRLHSLWTGGRNAGKGQWVWTGTGQDIGYSNWAIGRPEDIPDFIKKDFLCLGRNDLKWHRAWDSTVATGICEKQSVCQPKSDWEYSR